MRGGVDNSSGDREGGKRRVGKVDVQKRHRTILRQLHCEQRSGPIARKFHSEIGSRAVTVKGDR